MKKTILCLRFAFIIIAFLVSTLAYSHPKTQEEKKEVYEFIQKQVDENKIDLATAQKMWAAYIRCCEESKN